jgi:enamine deaminase RidA (YjgF/YER057c/UK114 family)
MNIIRNIRTPIMYRAVEANGLVFVGGTIADDTSVSMGEQTRNILGKIAGYLKEAGTDMSRVVSASIFVTDLDCTPGMRHDNFCDSAVAMMRYRALFCANAVSNSRGDWYPSAECSRSLL